MANDSGGGGGMSPEDFDAAFAPEATHLQRIAALLEVNGIALRALAEIGHGDDDAARVARRALDRARTIVQERM